ncbi:hypothetical protein PFLmoz3_00995 [Pseudomonas fluorescens]|uniref:Uncharacterized protein n=1 Tax=Pseudomonas fluorescens TaxID=294 RepID=A0A109LKZ1_PSEFL|nr:hypothetical protein PFLmoz3_00995 [Pseudomonas fluorescens]
MGNFRLGAEPHPGAFVDQVKSNLDLLVGRHGLATKDLMAESCCLGLIHSGLGFSLSDFATADPLSTEVAIGAVACD